MLRPTLLAALALAACGARPQVHRSGSADASIPARPTDRSNASPREVRAEPIRAVSAPAIRAVSAPAIREVSLAAVAALRAPHRSDTGAPPPRTPADLRALVGHRDVREPVAAALALARELGFALDPRITSGAALVAWASEIGRLHDATVPPEPGDLLVFDRVNSSDPADLVAIAIARDGRGVTEFVFLGGGVMRRGFVDASRPATKRDRQRAIVNTFLRTGKRWPAKGSRYLAGEHLAHVIR